MTEQPPPPGYSSQPPPPPGYPPQPPTGTPPDNYLVWSILVTIVCCNLLGIVAIVKSSQVNSLWAQGRYADAQASADSAKKWAIGTAIFSLVWWFICGAIWVVIFLIGAASSPDNNAAMLAALL